MDPFGIVTGTAVPLTRGQVDTDQIIPAVFLRRITKSGYDDGLFQLWMKDPDFVLNDPAYQGATFLFAGPEFGIGSSREHAVWALRDYGFRAVFAPSYSDIFRGNAGKNGFLAGAIPEADIERIWAAIQASPGIEATVDLEARTVSIGELTVGFEIDDYTRWRLLEGLDDIGLTLRDEDAITAFEAQRPSWLPTTIPARHA